MIYEFMLLSREETLNALTTMIDRYITSNVGPEYEESDLFTNKFDWKTQTNRSSYTIIQWHVDGNK